LVLVTVFCFLIVVSCFEIEGCFVIGWQDWLFGFLFFFQWRKALICNRMKLYYECNKIMDFILMKASETQRAMEII